LFFYHSLLKTPSCVGRNAGGLFRFSLVRLLLAVRTVCLTAGAFVRRDHAPSFAGKALAYTPGRRCFSLSFRAGFPSVVAREQIMLVLCTSFGLLRFARSLGVSAFLPLIYLLFASE